MGSHLQLGGSDFLHLRGHSLCCEIQTAGFIAICIACDTRTDQGNQIHTKYAFWIGRQSANHSKFIVHVVLDVSYYSVYNIWEKAVGTSGPGYCAYHFELLIL